MKLNKTKKGIFISLGVLFFVGIPLLLLKLSDMLFPYLLDTSITTTPGNNRSVILREYPPLTTAVFIPEDSYLSDTDTLEKKKYFVKANRDGFIVPQAASVDLENKIDVIFFGGSTTEVLYVDEAVRFPSLVGKIISDNVGREVKILNGGKSGNNSFHSVINLLAKGVKYKPKFVVLCHNVNDWSLLSKTGSYFVGPQSKNVIVEHSINRSVYELTRHAKNWLLPNSWHWLKTNIRNFRLSPVSTVDEFNSFDEYQFESNQIMGFFRSSVESFIGVSRAWNVTPILMTQMSRLGPEGDLAPNNLNIDIKASYHKSFNDEIRSIGKEHDVLVIDLDKHLSGKREYIYDSVHLNSKGSLAAAQIISTTLMENYMEQLSRSLPE